MKRIQSSVVAAVVALAACGTIPVDQPMGQTPNALAESKVAICHVPSGVFADEHTIAIAEEAIEPHLLHGDALAACGPLGCIARNDGPCSSEADCCPGLSCGADGLCNPRR